MATVIMMTMMITPTADETPTIITTILVSKE